jgi:uncharacterized protein
MALSVFKEKPGEFILAPDAEEMRLARELMSNIDGFLTAVVVGPEPIEPSEWLPRVGFGLIAGSAIDQRMGLLAKVLVDRHDEIREQVEIGEAAVRPMFLPKDQDRAIAEEWSEGFLEGVRLRPKLWAEMYEGPERVLLAPMLLHARNENGEYFALEAAKGAPENVLQIAAEAIPASVVEIYHYWRQRRGLEPEGGLGTFHYPNVGRNEPCPCGSGKKFKRCHGGAA